MASEALKNDYDEDEMEEDASLLGTQELTEMRESNTSTWAKLDYAGKQKRAKIAASLKKFQEATGIDESKHIRDVKSMRNGHELQEKEEKMKAASKKWYREKIDGSGLFDAMHPDEEEYAKFERDQLIKKFNGLQLAEGDVNMTSVLSTIDKDLQPRREFRSKLRLLKEKTPLAFEEYIALLPTLGLVGSKEALLNTVTERIKPVMDMPLAVQHAFKERRKSLGKNKDTATLVAEVKGEFQKKVDSYNKALVANKQYFGGNTLKEFQDWFVKLDNFAEMDAAAQELTAPTGPIAKRKKLYDQAQAIIAKAKPENQAKLKEMVGELRRHQLENFMQSLENSVEKDNMTIAESGSELLKEVDGVPLFTQFEIANEGRKMQKLSLKSQSGQAEALKLEAEEREKVVRDYLKLPDNMRDDETFLESNNEDRTRMLQEAGGKRLTGNDNPFDLAADEDSGYVDELADALEDDEGSNNIDNFMNDLDSQGELKSAELINITRNRIGLSDQQMGKYKEDPKEAYLRDTRKWIRLDEGAKKKEDVHTGREKTKVMFMDEADNAYDKGFVLNSAGIVRERQDVTARELRHGDEKALERVKRARYGFEIQVQKEDGTAQERETGKMLDELSEEQMRELVERVVTMLLGQMKVSAGKAATIKNSGKIKDVISDRLIKNEHFSSLRKRKEHAHN